MNLLDFFVMAPLSQQFYSVLLCRIVFVKIAQLSPQKIVAHYIRVTCFYM